MELHSVREFRIERQVELELELEAGEYVIIPQTTGCQMRKMDDAGSGSISRLINGSGELHPIADMAVRDLFKRLDKIIINNSLDYPEFQEFFSRIQVPISQEEFTRNILRRFSSDAIGSINRRAFLEFFKDAHLKQGEQTLWKWLSAWGYDKELWCPASRCFMLTFHSLTQLQLSIEEDLTGDMDAKASRLIL